MATFNNQNVFFRGSNSHHSEKITDSGRVAFRWRVPDACVPRKFCGDVTFGAADHGQRAQEEIWTLIALHVHTFCLLSSAFSFLGFFTAVNTSYLLMHMSY